jgi:hypothetical protein
MRRPWYIAPCDWRAVLNHSETTPSRYLHDRRQIGRLAIEVNRHHSFRPWTDSCFQFRWIERVVVSLDIYKSFPKRTRRGCAVNALLHVRPLRQDRKPIPMGTRRGSKYMHINTGFEQSQDFRHDERFGRCWEAERKDADPEGFLYCDTLLFLAKKL